MKDKLFWNIAAIAQNTEPENTILSSLSPSSQTSAQLIWKTESETTLLPIQRSFTTRKLVETIAPRERGFSLSEIKRAHKLDTSKFEIPEQESSSTISPLITTTIEVQSDHLNYLNVTQEE